MTHVSTHSSATNGWVTASLVVGVFFVGYLTIALARWPGARRRSTLPFGLIFLAFLFPPSFVLLWLILLLPAREPVVIVRESPPALTSRAPAATFRT
jgi:hypothetical protein